MSGHQMECLSNRYPFGLWPVAMVEHSTVMIPERVSDGSRFDTGD